MLSHAQYAPRRWVVALTPRCPASAFAHSPEVALAAHELPQEPTTQFSLSMTRDTLYPNRESPFPTGSRVLPVLDFTFRRHLLVVSWRSNPSNNIRAHQRTFRFQYPPPRQQITPMVVLPGDVLDHVVELAQACTPSGEVLRRSLA